MFSGFGVFLDGLMFGLIFEDDLYLKVDDVNRPEFVAADLGPFVYQARGRTVTVSYHRAPEPIEDWQRFGPWATGALAAARRAGAAKSARRRSERSGANRR